MTERQAYDPSRSYRNRSEVKLPHAGQDCIFLRRPPPRNSYDQRNRAAATRTKRPLEGLEEPPSFSRRPPPSRSLRCEPLREGEAIREVWWRTESDPIPHAVETSLMPVLVPRKHKEMGMVRNKSKREIKRIKAACREHGVNIAIACSLRRHYIKSYHLQRTMSSLGLGKEADIRESAQIFENIIEEYLVQHGVAYYSEKEQREYNNPVTPDFLLKRPVLLRSYRLKEEEENANAGTKRKWKEVVHEMQIHWIEVKMFYGASAIERDEKSAVGCVLKAAEKYTHFHGTGAMIFMQGFGDRLGQQLLSTGVVPLDCSSRHNVKLKEVRKHQSTWCATPSGEILP